MARIYAWAKLENEKSKHARRMINIHARLRQDTLCSGQMRYLLPALSCSKSNWPWVMVPARVLTKGHGTWGELATLALALGRLALPICSRQSRLHPQLKSPAPYQPLGRTLRISILGPSLARKLQCVCLVQVQVSRRLLHDLEILSCEKPEFGP